MHPWNKAAVIALDVETRTVALPGDPEANFQIKDLGLSALAPVTDIAFYTPDHGEVVFDFTDCDIHQSKPTPAVREKWAQIQTALCRPDVTLVGHRIIFDLRQIGVHYNVWRQKHFPDLPKFILPLGTRVWDTQIMAYRMMLGERASERSPFADSFALAGELNEQTGKIHIGITERLGLLDPDSRDYEFYIWMKSQRAVLSHMPEILSKLPAEHAVWHFLQGWIPPNRPDLLQQAADRVRHEYVMMDARLAYQLYERQQQIADKLATADYCEYGLVIPKWPELTTQDIHPEFGSLLDLYQRRLRLSANRSIQGLLINSEHLEQHRARAQTAVLELTETILQQPDKHDPYVNFETVFSVLLYYQMLLDLAANPKKSFTDPTRWARWSYIALSPIVVRDALTWPNNEQPDESIIQVWLDYLQLYTKRGAALKARPGLSIVPRIDLLEWVRRNCYQDYPDPYDRFLAEIKGNWLSHFYKRTQADLRREARDYWREHPTEAPEDTTDESLAFRFGLDLTRSNQTNSLLWKAYYVFCVAAAPLPTSDEFKYTEGLTTDKFKKALMEYRREHHGEEPPDFREFVLTVGGISYGKQAMKFYLENEEYGENAQALQPLKELEQSHANIAWLTQFAEHAALDGAVHSLIVPAARTGRSQSSTPNLQNIPMRKNTPYPGLFVAPHGFRLIELDYSNAEVRMGNMIGGDNAGASITEDDDYHSAHAAIYWPEDWASADKERRKELRALSKRVTFSTNYGAGAYKAALILKGDLTTARQVLDNKRRFFWKTEQKKKELDQHVQQRLRAGCVPVFVTLWSRERCQVDRVGAGSRIMVYNTGWNSLQQGGVTAMISRADVLISEMLERENYRTFVQQDIHDSLLLAFDIKEYATDLPQRIIQIMNSIMPDVYCERTTPKTHFVAELGPENAFKWGYHSSQPYPFPLDEFINAWGRFKLDDEMLALPPEERETPTWLGPVHEGWTLEKETAVLTARRQAAAALDSGNGDVHAVSQGEEWVEFQMQLALLETPVAADRDLALRLQMPMQLVYRGPDGQPQMGGTLVFAAWMAASRVLYHRGNSPLYPEMLRKVRDIVQRYPDHFSSWTDRYASLLEL